MTTDKKQVNVRLPRELVESFEDYYPQVGAKTWFFEQAMRRFLELHVEAPEDLISEAVTEVRID